MFQRGILEMKYFIDEEQRKLSGSTNYFEFIKGKYRGKCWLPDSLSLDMDEFDRLGLDNLISSAVPSFDYFGLTKITLRDWEKILSKAHAVGGEAEAAVAEIDEWAREVFSEYKCITIFGI